MSDVLKVVAKGLRIPRPLYKKGEISCVCPFHNDTQRSFFISIEQQVYHCFGCGEKGSLVNLAMKVTGVGFFKAMSLLREWGVEDFENGSTAKVPPVTEAMYRALDDNGWQAYLDTRGFDTTFVEKFGVRYDKISDAIVIPIRNKKYKLSGMKYRKILGKTFWYTKGFQRSRHLFGEVRIREQKMVYVVEGELDAIKVQQYGYPAVAIMGTELSKTQRGMLEEYKHIILCMDNDEAGRKATKKIGRQFIEDKVKASYVMLPKNYDPAMCTKTEFSEAVKKVRVIKSR